MNFESKEHNNLMVNGVWLNEEQRTARVFGKVKKLSQNQTRFLKLLMRDPGRFFSREEIMDYVGGHDYIVDERSVDSLVGDTRNKLFDGKEAGTTFIVAKHGIGYCIPDLRKTPNTTDS